MTTNHDPRYGDRLRARLYLAKEHPDVAGDPEFQAVAQLWMQAQREDETELGLLDYFDSLPLDQVAAMAQAVTDTVDPTSPPSTASSPRSAGSGE